MFVAVLQLVIFIVVIAVTICLGKKKGEALKRLAGVFGGTIPSFSLYSSMKATYNGKNFTVSLIPQSKNSPAYLDIYFFKETFFKLKIYKESIFSQIGKKIGLVHEVQTTDALFDSEFLIFSDKPDQVVTRLYDKQVKDKIRELFVYGFTSFVCDGKKFYLRKPNYTVEFDLEPAQFKKIIEDVDFLAQRL